MSECSSSFIVRALPAKVSVSILEVLSELVKHAVFHVPSNATNCAAAAFQPQFEFFHLRPWNNLTERVIELSLG